MKKLLTILLLLSSLSVFSQSHLTHFGNYNPPDDPAVDTGWLTTGFFFYFHGKGHGFILQAYGVGVYYDTRKFEIDFEDRIAENRRIIHKKHKKK